MTGNRAEWGLGGDHRSAIEGSVVWSAHWVSRTPLAESERTTLAANPSIEDGFRMSYLRDLCSFNCLNSEVDKRPP